MEGTRKILFADELEPDPNQVIFVYDITYPKSVKGESDEWR